MGHRFFRNVLVITSNCNLFGKTTLGSIFAKIFAGLTILIVISENSWSGRQRFFAHRLFTGLKPELRVGLRQLRVIVLFLSFWLVVAQFTLSPLRFDLMHVKLILVRKSLKLVLLGLVQFINLNLA